MDVEETFLFGLAIVMNYINLLLFIYLFILFIYLFIYSIIYSLIYSFTFFFRFASLMNMSDSFAVVRNKRKSKNAGESTKHQEIKRIGNGISGEQ